MVVEEGIFLLGELFDVYLDLSGVRIFLCGLCGCPVFAEIVGLFFRGLLEAVGMEEDVTSFFEELVEDSRWVLVSIGLSLGYASYDSIAFQM